MKTSLSRCVIKCPLSPRRRPMQQTYMMKTKAPNALQLVKTKELKSHMVTTKERKVPYGAMTMLRTKRPKAQNHLVLVSI